MRPIQRRACARGCSAIRSTANAFRTPCPSLGVHTTRSPAASPHAGYAIEIAVARDDVQAVLDRERADPDVVLGNRSALGAKRLAYRGVPGCGLEADGEHPRFADQLVEQPLQAAAIP